MRRVTAGVREEGKARRKDQIIQAAKRLLAAGGLDALSTRKLAQEAELSVHTLYTLVGSKAQILGAVMEDNHNRVLANILDIDEQHPVEKIFAIVETTYKIIVEDRAGQKALMRVLMTLYYEGGLNPNPWWLLAQEKGWMDAAVAEAMRQKILKAEFTPATIGGMLMKIYLANLREYLFGKCDLETFRTSTLFEFWFILSNLATDPARKTYLKNARASARKLR
jgi:AcrR family transcriptional regulator